MTSQLWNLPGPRAWIESISDQVDEGRPTIIACPAPSTPPTLGTALTNTLSTSRLVEIDQLSADVVDGVEDALLADRVARELGIALPTGTIARAIDLACQPALRGIALWVDARNYPKEVACKWVTLGVQLAAVAQTTSLDERLRFAVAINAGDDVMIPEPDSNLAVIWWWGVLGPIDAALYFRDFHHGAVHAAELTEIHRWSLENLTARESFSAAHENPVGKDQVDNSTHGSVATPTPDKFRTQWAAGLVECWDGRLDVHVSITGDSDRRRWLAQIKTVFPALELVRVELARRVAELAEQRRIDRTEVIDLELSLLKGWIYERALRLSRDDWNLLRIATAARHRLAHLEPLNIDELAELEIASQRSRAPLRLT